MIRSRTSRAIVYVSAGLALGGWLASAAVGQEGAADRPRAELSAEQIKGPAAPAWRTLVVGSVLAVKADQTVPANVCVRFQDGGALELGKGVKLIIAGPVDAPPQVQIFRGEGKVVFPRHGVEKVYPQWWGAMTGDGADDAAAIQAAIDSRADGGTVFLPAGQYDLSSRITLASGLILEGSPAAARLNALKALPAMIQRPDLTPPPDGIHYNKNTRVDGVRMTNLMLDGNGSHIGLDMTNVNYTWIENLQVQHCKTGIMFAQLGMYETLINPAVAYCDTGIEFNVGSMDSNIFGGRISVCDAGILINVTGHLNIYGITFDAFKKTGIDIRGGDCTNLHYAWFDSVAPAVAIRIARGASQCSVVNPRFSGPTPKEIQNDSPTSLILDAAPSVGDTLTSSLLRTRALYAAGISATTRPAENLRGRVTVSGAKRHGPYRALATVTFPVPEADADYYVAATCVSASDDVPEGARRVWIKAKTTTGFDVVLEDAPGAGRSVEVDWIMVR